MKQRNELKGLGTNRIAVLLTNREKGMVEYTRKAGARSWSAMFVQLLLNQHEALQHLG